MEITVEGRNFTVSVGPALTASEMEVVQELMEASNRGMEDEAHLIQRQLGCTLTCALDVVYLRTRSRHTPALERRLIEEHRAGHRINMCEWPPERYRSVEQTAALRS